MPYRRPHQSPARLVQLADLKRCTATPTSPGPISALLDSDVPSKRSRWLSCANLLEEQASTRVWMACDGSPILQRFSIVRLVGMHKMGEVLGGRLFLKDFLGFARRFHGIMVPTPHVELPLSRSRKVLFERSCLSRPGVRRCLLAGDASSPGCLALS
jgi:hypothetical protein